MTGDFFPSLSPPPHPPLQGDTERIIGSWFKATGARDKIVLATKVAGYGNEYLRPADGKTRITKKQILAAVDSSLARLGTDFIDLYQIHWPDRYVPLFGAGAFDEALMRESVSFEDQMEGMRAAVDAGKVRYWGVSNETTWGVSAFLRLAEAGLGPRIVSIQNSYSLLVRSAYETDLAEACAAVNGNVGLLAYSPLAGGVLSGKYIDGSAAANSRLNLFQGYMERYNKSLARQAVAEYAAVATKHGLTPTQLALGWCAGRWNVASSIIGATTMDQLKANLAAFDVVLSEEVLEDVERVYQRFRDPTTKPLD